MLLSVLGLSCVLLDLGLFARHFSGRRWLRADSLRLGFLFHLWRRFYLLDGGGRCLNRSSSLLTSKKLRKQSLLLLRRKHAKDIRGVLRGRLRSRCNGLLHHGRLHLLLHHGLLLLLHGCLMHAAHLVLVQLLQRTHVLLLRRHLLLHLAWMRLELIVLVRKHRLLTVEIVGRTSTG